MPSNTTNPIDCFATAIKLVVDASLIDPRCAAILPKMAATFANVAKDPKGKASLGPNMPSSANSSVPPPSAVTFLVEAIRVLSLASPVFGSHVLNLIPLIISCMTPSEPAGFASTEVGAETSPVNCEKNATDKVVVEPSKKHCKPSSPSIASSDDDMNKKMPSKPSASRSDGSVSSQEAHSYDETSLISSRENNSAIVASKKATIEPLYASDTSAATTYSYSSNKGKRKERAEVEGKQVPDRIPKKLKQPFKFESTMAAPSYSGKEGYDARAYFRDPESADGFMLFTSAQDRNKAYSMTDEQRRDAIPLPVLIHRHKLWQRVVQYTPDKRCIPTDTYLVIMVTCNGSSDAPYLLKKFENEAELKDKELYGFLSIKKIIMIPRPLGSGFMYYCIPDLHKWLHGTLHIATIQDIHFKECTKHIEDVVIIKPGQDFRDTDLGIQVKYEDFPDRNAPPLRELIPYVAKEMDLNTSSARKVPCLSAGWSTANPNEYKRNRINILGSIMPSLSDGAIRQLEQCDRNKIIDLVCHVIRFMSPYRHHPHPFFHSDPNILKMREELALKFLQSLGTTSKYDDERYFRAEGIAFIFNNYVPFHVDTMNDTAVGMNETLAMNCQCVIGHELAGIPSVKKAMSLFNLKVGDPLSFSMVLYSRKVVGDYVKKQLRIQPIKEAICKDDHPNLPDCWWLLKPLLIAIESIDSEVNTNAIWDDFTTLHDYIEDIQCEPKSSQYKDKYISLQAGFDKMRHWSPVKYLVDVLHARKIIHMHRDDVMGFICFAALETNGTFLLSAIVDEVLSSTTPSATLFMKEVDTHGLYAALIFAAQRKNEEAGSGSGYASSQKPRFQYNKRGTNNKFPIAGGIGIHSFRDADKEKISERCMNIVASLADECYKLHSSVGDVGMKDRTGSIDVIARMFYTRIHEIGGPGVGHDEALNFIELTSIFGFLPFDIINWACAGGKTSSAYKAINHFHKMSLSSQGTPCGDLTEELADKYFKIAVKYVSSTVNWNFSPAMAENILSLVHMKECNSMSPPPCDILYVYSHRKNSMNHLYRWKLDTPAKAILQVLLITDKNEVEEWYNLFEVTRDGSRLGSNYAGCYWTNNGYQKNCSGGIKSSAEYVLTPNYIDALL